MLFGCGSFELRGLRTGVAFANIVTVQQTEKMLRVLFSRVPVPISLACRRDMYGFRVRMPSTCSGSAGRYDSSFTARRPITNLDLRDAGGVTYVLPGVCVWCGVAEHCYVCVYARVCAFVQ